MREGKKRKNRLITAAMAGILTLILSLAALPMHLRAMENTDSYDIYILDYEDLLTDEEEDALYYEMEGLAAYGGKLIEVPYTVNDKVKKCDKKIREKLMMPEYRRKRLRQLLAIRPLVKAMEVHSGLTGLIVEKTVVGREGRFDQFDAMWISSLCDSTAKGKPDIELVAYN